VSAALLPGTRVLARGLAWEVVEAEPAGAQQRLRLRCQQGALRGQEVDLLHPFEPVERLATDLDPRHAGQLRPWLLYHQAFLLEQALGPHALVAAQPGRLEVAPYQLVPVMRALAMPRPRLLLADGVGLGKTIEAGLILAEWIARRRAHRILVVSPAGPLLDQWQREMRVRFGLRFEPLADWGALQEVRRGLELGANPFDALPLCLVSIDFVKQEKVLQELERSEWDVVVIDEAHHCAHVGASAEREASLRRRLAEVLSRQADALLLLTATPHDGYDPHFASLVELLDPSLVDGRGALRGDRYRRHVVRRLKQHVRDPATGAPLFPDRQVTPRPVPFAPASHPRFAAYQEALLALVAPRLRAALRTRRYGDVLAFIALLKRSVSTAAACRNTLRVVADRFEEISQRTESAQEERRQRLRTLRALRERIERFGTTSPAEEADLAALEAEDMAAEILASGADELIQRLGATHRELRRHAEQGRRATATHEALRALVGLADAATAEDPKLAAMLAELRAIRAAEPRANVLVYTEYIDSQAALVVQLGEAVARGDLSGEVLALSGDDAEAARTQVFERFTTKDDLILVSTDATAEGLNLHARCHQLLHLELPYNPNRLEQRNGRIDRFGQKHAPQIRYLFLAGTFEERLLARLVAKYERQRALLSFVPNTLGAVAQADSAVATRLLAGLAEEDGALFQRPASELRFDAEPDDDATTPAYRELLEEVDRAVSGFERAARTSAWLGDVGLFAEERYASEAEAARQEGASAAGTALLDFVNAALEQESPGAVTRESDGTVTFRLPPQWLHGLDDLPGFDAESRTLRASGTAAGPTDEAQHVAVIGRAHPLVRRAIEHARHVQHGGGSGWLDTRASAARAPGAKPELLATFLASVRSGAGPEWERVVAVRVAKGGTPQVLLDPAAWTGLAAPGRAIPTAKLWERHFAAWGEGGLSAAERAALQELVPTADAFTDEHTSIVANEERALADWLRLRGEEICGPRVLETLDLFASSAPEASRGAWRAIESPAERLAGFAKDTTQPAAKRREAEGVLRLHRARALDLARHGALEPLRITPLGLLMLVPGAGA